MEDQIIRFAALYCGIPPDGTSRFYFDLQRFQPDFLFNPSYAQTNNLASLCVAESWVGGDPFLYLHSDIVYHPQLLERAVGRLDGAEASLLVDVGEVDQEAMKVRVEGGRFIESSKEISRSQALGE